MLWHGNAVPLLTICLMETLHACFVNRFRAKGSWRTGPVPIVQDNLMVRWKVTIDKRLLAEIDKSKLGDPSSRRSNQYGPAHSMIGQINEEAERALELLSRSRCKPAYFRPKKLGTFLHYEQSRTKTMKAASVNFTEWEAFRKETRRKWHGMNARQKRQWQDHRDAAAALRPIRKREGMHSSLKSSSQSSDTKLPTSAYKAGSTKRPIADSVVDAYSSVASCKYKTGIYNNQRQAKAFNIFVLRWFV